MTSVSACKGKCARSAVMPSLEKGEVECSALPRSSRLGETAADRC